MKKLLTGVILLLSLFAYGQTKDSIVTVHYQKDTTHITYHDTTYKVWRDSSYVIQVPIPFVSLKGFYDNDMSSYLGIAAKEDAQINWHVKNGDNSIAGYGFGDRITSTSKWPIIANYIKKCKRKGINVGFIYSSTATLASLSAYQAAQTSDSTKFTFVISELEPYNSGDYATFYKTIRAFSEWAKKQTPKVERCIYMGWPSAEAWDSIVTNSDKTYLHAYVQPATMTGTGIRGYTRGRTTTIANIVNAKYASNPTFKYKVAIIFSCEPSFAYNYFQTNSWDKPYTEYVSYFNSAATTVEKNRIQLSGRQIFKSSYGLQLKP